MVSVNRSGEPAGNGARAVGVDSLLAQAAATPPAPKPAAKPTPAARAVNSRSIDLADVNKIFYDLIKEMGQARLNGYENHGFLNTGLGAKNKLSCVEQSYILGKALTLRGYSASLAIGKDRNHAVVVIQNGNQRYAADPRMNTPFKSITKAELEQRLGLFSWLKKPQRFDLFDVRKINRDLPELQSILSDYRVDSPELRYIIRAPLPSPKQLNP